MKKIEKQKWHSAFVLQAALYKGGMHHKQQEWLCHAPSLGLTLNISASSHHSFELCL